jgi:hypothetical protein
LVGIEQMTRVDALHILAIESRSEFEALASRHPFVEILVFRHDSDQRLQSFLFADDVAIGQAAMAGAGQQLPAYSRKLLDGFQVALK